MSKNPISNPELLISDPKAKSLLSLVQKSLVEERVLRLAETSVLQKSLRKTQRITSTLGKAVVLGFKNPLPLWNDLSKAKRTEAQQAAWHKLVSVVAKTDGQPDIQRLKPGPDGSIDLDTLKPGQAAWVTAKSGPAAGRHVLVAVRPNGDFVLIGGMHQPNTLIDSHGKYGERGKEYLINHRGDVLTTETGKPRELTPEDLISHLSERHFTFKRRGKTTTETAKEKERRAGWKEHAERKAAVTKEYRESTKTAARMVRERKKEMREVLGLAELTTLTKESEKKIREGYEKAAIRALENQGKEIDETALKLAKQFATRATSKFRSERNKKIERVEEMLVGAASKASRGDKGELKAIDKKTQQIASKINTSAATVEDALNKCYDDMAKGEDAQEATKEAADTAVQDCMDHADFKATEEVEVGEEGEIHDHGNETTKGDIDKHDMIDQDLDADVAHQEMNLKKARSNLKTKLEKQKQAKKEKRKELVPEYGQVDAEPEFESHEEQEAFFSRIADAQRDFAIARVAQDRAKEEIKKIAEEAAAAGLSRRPRSAVSPDEFVIDLDAVSEQDIAKEMKLIETVQNTAGPTGPGFYTVINEFWNDSTGNTLDPHMRMGSEFALSGMMAEHLPKEIMDTPEIKSLLGVIGSKVEWNKGTNQFELKEAATKQKYHGLVNRTSASVAPMILSRRIAELAQRGNAERERIKDLVEQLDAGGLKRDQRAEYKREAKKLMNSPFAQHFGMEEMEKLIGDVRGWNKDNVLKTEEKTMKIDGLLRDRIKLAVDQLKTGEIVPIEEKLPKGKKGPPRPGGKLDPNTKIGEALVKTDNIDSLIQRRQKNLGMALGSLETSAAIGVALKEAHVKATYAAVGAKEVPEETKTAEEMHAEIKEVSESIRSGELTSRQEKYAEKKIKELENRIGAMTSTRNIPKQDTVRINIPGQITHPDPEKQQGLVHENKLAAYDYAKNQLGLSDNEIHEAMGKATVVPRGKLASIGVDSDGAHVHVKLGGVFSPEEAAAEVQAGKKVKRKPRGLLDKIDRINNKQTVEDRCRDIKENKEMPTAADHPPLIRDTMKTPDKETGAPVDLRMRLAQYNAYNFMHEPKMRDKDGKPVRGSKGGMNTMVTGGGKTLAALASIAGNHQEGNHMNYVISVPKGNVQQWIDEANEMSHFHIVGHASSKTLKSGEIVSEAPKSGAYLPELVKALSAQKGETNPTPVAIAVPSGKDTAKGYGIKGWGKEKQHEFFSKIHDILKEHGATEKKNIVFILDHEVDSNIHSNLTKTQLSWGHQHAQAHFGREKAEIGDIIEHLPRLGVRGRIVDEPQNLLSSGESSNRSNAGRRIFHSSRPMEFRQTLTATPVRRQAGEGYDGFGYVARTPVIDENGNFVTKKAKITTKKGTPEQKTRLVDRVQYHPNPLGSKTDFVSRMGGLGEGTFTHEHVVQQQVRDTFASWNIGDEVRDRHFHLSVHGHSVPRTESQRQRQIEIEQHSKKRIEEALAKEVKQRKVKGKQQFKDIEDLHARGKKYYLAAVEGALKHSETEHTLNINAAGVKRDENGEVSRRKKGTAKLPLHEHADWKHNSKIRTMVKQIQDQVDKAKAEGKTHRTVIVVNSPEQAAAAEKALAKIYPPDTHIDPTTKKKRSTKRVVSMARTMSGGSYVAAPKAQFQGIKDRFKGGGIDALIIDKDSAAGHNLQSADSLHSLGKLEDAAMVKQSIGRSDRSPRDQLSEEEIHKQVHDQIRRGGRPAARAAQIIRDATGEDPRGMTEKKLSKLLVEYRDKPDPETEQPRGKSAWQDLALKLGVFTEKPLQVHHYEQNDSPHELATADLHQQQSGNLATYSPQLMKEPHEVTETTHTATGKEVAKKGLFVKINLPKTPSLFVRN